MMWTGLPQLALIPLVPLVLKRVDARYLVSGGLTIFAISCFMNLELSRLSGADQLLLPNIVRAFGMAVVLGPLAGLAMAGMERENTGAASGLFNMMRNIGGAFGTAVLLTFFTHREQYHSSVINGNVSLGDPATQARIGALSQRFMAHGSDAVDAANKAVVTIGRTIHAQASLMGFGDTFGLLGVMLLLAALSVVLLKKTSGPTSAAAH